MVGQLAGERDEAAGRLRVAGDVLRVAIVRARPARRSPRATQNGPERERERDALVDPPQPQGGFDRGEHIAADVEEPGQRELPLRSVKVLMPAGDVVEQVRRQGQPRRVELARVGGQLADERAHGREHHEADPDPAVDGPDQAGLHHLGESLDDVAEVGRHRLHRLQREGLPEDHEPPAQPSRGVVEPVVAPRDRRGQRALTLGHVGGGGAQQLQADSRLVRRPASPSRRTRAAASSRARGMPSSNRHTSASSASWPVTWRSGSA